jgi:c-di-GMP-binding flagellar brake protein YcgR
MARKTKPTLEPTETSVPDEFIERRKAARLDIPIRVDYIVHGSNSSDQKIPATTKNISAGGCLLVAEEKIDLGSLIELHVFLGDGDAEALRLNGTVVRPGRAAKGVYEYGISFSGMSSGARRLFADFCFAKMYEMVGLPDWPTDRKINK